MEEVPFDCTPLWLGMISISRDERKDIARRGASWTEAQRYKTVVDVPGSRSAMGDQIGK